MARHGPARRGTAGQPWPAARRTYRCPIPHLRPCFTARVGELPRYREPLTSTEGHIELADAELPRITPDQQSATYGSTRADCHRL